MARLEGKHGIIGVFTRENEVTLPVGDIAEETARRIEELGHRPRLQTITNRRLDTPGKFFSSIGISPREREEIDMTTGVVKHIPTVKLPRVPNGNGHKERMEGEEEVHSVEEGEALIRRTLRKLLTEKGLSIDPVRRIKELRVVKKGRQSDKIEDESKRGFKVHADLDTHHKVKILRRNGGGALQWETIQIPPEGHPYSHALQLEGSPRDIERAARALSTSKLNLVARLEAARLFGLSHMGEGDLVRHFETIDKDRVASSKKK